MEDDDVLADRVDIEPPIFKGCSSSELLAMLLVAVTVWVPLSVLLAFAVGKLVYALAILAVGVIGSVVVGATSFQRIKRNRPDHFYVHLVKRLLHLVRHLLHLTTLSSFSLTWRSGYWDVDRS